MVEKPVPIAFAPILDTKRPVIEHCPYCHAPLLGEYDEAEHRLECYDPEPEPDPDDDCRS